MRKIYKITNMALIFMLIVVTLYTEVVYAHNARYLRIPLDRERVEITLGKTKVLSTNRLISQAFLGLSSPDKKEIIEAMQFLSDLHIKEAIAAIRPFLNNNDPGIKNMAKASLWVLGDKETTKNYLSRLLKGKFKNIQEFALMSRLLVDKNYKLGVKYRAFVKCCGWSL